MDVRPLIIIGAGLAGWSTIREFRKLNPIASVMLVCADTGGHRTLPFVMPIMAAAKALAATLAGQHTELVFPTMPVAVKKPALPIVVVHAEPGTAGAWCKSEEGVWHFIGATGPIRGFVLTGKQTTRRAELARSMSNL